MLFEADQSRFALYSHAQNLT